MAGERQIKITLLVAVFSIAAVWSARAEISRPEGRYCGEVFHNGHIVHSEINFGVDSEGGLSGTMRYRDGEIVTEGRVREITPGEGFRRTLEWSDKYGFGFAIMQFSPKFDEFDGVWGTGIEKPRNVWNGKRCNNLTS